MLAVGDLVVDYDLVDWLQLPSPRRHIFLGIILKVHIADPEEAQILPVLADPDRFQQYTIAWFNGLQSVSIDSSFYRRGQLTKLSLQNVT
jgi:hypothetical protein